MLTLDPKARHRCPFLMIEVDLLLSLICKLVDSYGLPSSLMINCSLDVGSVVLGRD